VLHPGALATARQLQQDYNFDGIKLVLPTTVFDERHELNLDGTEVQLIFVGPCHQAGDTIVHVPQEGVVFAGDVLFRLCTPMGWTGTYAKWLKTLDLIISLHPKVVVPGHGPVCGIEGVKEMRAYLEYLRDESKRSFEKRAVLPGRFQADRSRTVCHVACPGTPLSERRAGLPGISQRTGGQAVGFDEGLRRDLRSGKGPGNRDRVLTDGSGIGLP
jgi:glyoxylase-like metal-dependent hydrolase (beta-lactamase superfamily II)